MMRVLFFAVTADLTGARETIVETSSPLDADALWAELIARFPSLAAQRAVVRLALNGEYAGPSARFGDGDEVALIPPVSGG